MNLVPGIRLAKPTDVSLILSFIQRKAEFDRKIGAFSGELGVSEAKLFKSLFGAVPLAYVLLGENQGRDVGFALYGFRYSSFAGRPSLWLDDLYVDQAARNQGIGTALMQCLAHIAWDYECTHLGWTADARNAWGLKFYHRLGAEITEQYGNRCVFRWIPVPLLSEL